jgi:hypothetical protein
MVLNLDVPKRRYLRVVAADIMMYYSAALHIRYDGLACHLSAGMI